MENLSDQLIQKQNQLKGIFRILFPIFWVILSGIVLYPVISEYSSFPFLTSNIVLLATLGIMINWLFFYKYSLIIPSKWFKTVFIILGPVMLFNMYYVVSDFNFYLDRNMVLDDLVALDYQRQEWLAAYVKSEFLFVGISTTISTFLVIFHFVRLLWKQINNR